jgi:aquaporin Z
MNEMIQQMMMAGNGSNGMNSNSTEADPQELENAMNMNNMTASEAELEARIAFLPFIGVALGVYLFSKISMAHFNPAVTLGFLITKQITRLQLLYYFTAEILGALLGSLFVMAVIERENDLGANSPNYAFPRPTIFGIEVLASALLMAVILVVVNTKGLRGYSGLVIGGIVGLDIFFLAFISGASMNPARSLAPAIASGVRGNLWLYWSATFIGTSIVAFLVRKKFAG